MMSCETQISAGIYTFVKHHLRSVNGDITYAVPGRGRATEAEIFAWAKRNNLNPRLEIRK